MEAARGMHLPTTLLSPCIIFSTSTPIAPSALLVRWDSIASLPAWSSFLAPFLGRAIQDCGTVVDVGASHGHVSVHLATDYHSLKFIVQALPEVISGAKSSSNISEEFTDRVTS